MKIMNINLIKNIEYAELLSQPENSKLSKLILKKLKSLPDYEVKQNNFFIEFFNLNYNLYNYHFYKKVSK